MLMEIRNIIEWAIRDRNEGKLIPLDSSLTELEIKHSISLWIEFLSVEIFKTSEAKYLEWYLKEKRDGFHETEKLVEMDVQIHKRLKWVTIVLSKS